MSDPRQTGPAKHEKIPRIEVYWTCGDLPHAWRFTLLLILAIVAGDALILIHPDWYSSVAERHVDTSGGHAGRRRRLRCPESGALCESGRQSGSEEGQFGELGKRRLSHHARQRRSGSHRRATAPRASPSWTAPPTPSRTIPSSPWRRTPSIATAATSVAVHISSGAVDLATGTWESPRSKAEVSFANARASLQENSRAAVRSDPASDENQITVRPAPPTCRWATSTWKSASGNA